MKVEFLRSNYNQMVLNLKINIPFKNNLMFWIKKLRKLKIKEMKLLDYWKSLKLSSKSLIKKTCQYKTANKS